MRQNQFQNYTNIFIHAAGVQIGLGYRFNPNFTIGASAGTIIGEKSTQFPLCVETTYGFLKKWHTPFISAAAGYALALRTAENPFPIAGGLSVAGRFGYRFYVSKEIGITFDIGYRGGQRYAYFPDKWFHGGETRIGFIF